MPLVSPKTDDIAAPPNAKPHSTPTAADAAPGVDFDAPPVPARTVWFMAISTGLIVANIYYAQPLLAEIARQFNLSVTQAGALAMTSQIGTAFGMLLFVPLGDVRERRSLITVLLIASTISLLLFAVARNALWLTIASLAVGASASIVHVIVPFAAHLAPTRQRGRVLGVVMSGMLFGILLARTASGLIGAHFGWRVVYILAAILMALLTLSVRFFLPRSEPQVSLPYHALLRSVASLVRQHAGLRESALLGALLFAGFSAFWTTLVFLLATPPFHYGADVAGLFGLVGAAGALGAPLVGRLADRHGARTTLGIALLIVLASFLWLGLVGKSMIGLIVGVVFLDLGVQSGHVSNQTRIYAIAPEAKSRLNTFYMVSYFTGGALGSVLGAWSWRVAHWPGVCAFALAATILALLVYRLGRKHTVSADLPGHARDGEVVMH
jgi:predicted MFS family arabinose efflux permease